jgi:hypothetical protein
LWADEKEKKTNSILKSPSLSFSFTTWVHNLSGKVSDDYKNNAGSVEQRPFTDICKEGDRVCRMRIIKKENPNKELMPSINRITN